MTEVSVDGDDVKNHIKSATNLHHDLEKLQQSHDELLHQVDAEKAKVDKLSSQLEETKIINDSLTKQLGTKDVKLKEAQETIDSLRKQVNELQENGLKIDKIKMLAVKLKKDLAIEKDEHEKRKSSENQAKEQLKILQKEHEKVTSLYQQSVRNFQTLQGEYDRLQDDFDQCKAGAKSINSDLTNSVTELSKVKEDLAGKMLEIDSLTAKVNNLMEIVSNYEERCKEMESHVIVLRSELANEKKKVVAGIGLEKSLEEFKNQLDIKTNMIINLEETLETFKKREKEFYSLRPEYESVCQEKQSLTEEVSTLKETITELEKKIESFNSCLEEEKIKSSELIGEKTSLSTKLKTVEEESARKVKSLIEKIAGLEESLALSEEELKSKDEEFEAYKARVCKVLNQNKQATKELDEVKELREKLDHLKQSQKEESTKFAKLIEEKSLLELQLRQSGKEKDELSRSLKKLDSLIEDNQKLKNLARDLQNRLVIERENYEKEFKKIDQDNGLVIQALRQEISDLKTKITCLEDELSNLQHQHQNDVNLSYCASCKSLASLNLQESSPIPSTCDYNSNDSDPHHSNHLNDLSNESIGTHSPITLERRTRLSSCSSSVQSHVNPLLEILNSKDDEDILNRSSNHRMTDTTNEKESLRRQINDLTQLLKESESNNALLVEQNRVLKDEIRRIQRSIERAEIVQNMEYLKNILVKFISSHSERCQLVPVITTILKLNKQEEEIFIIFANNTNLINSPKSTNSYQSHQSSSSSSSSSQQQAIGSNWSSYLWQSFS